MSYHRMVCLYGHRPALESLSMWLLFFGAGFIVARQDSLKDAIIPMVLFLIVMGVFDGLLKSTMLICSLMRKYIHISVKVL